MLAADFIYFILCRVFQGWNPDSLYSELLNNKPSYLLHRFSCFGFFTLGFPRDLCLKIHVSLCCMNVQFSKWSTCVCCSCVYFQYFLNLISRNNLYKLNQVGGNKPIHYNRIFTWYQSDSRSSWISSKSAEEIFFCRVAEEAADPERASWQQEDVDPEGDNAEAAEGL